MELFNSSVRSCVILIPEPDVDITIKQSRRPTTFMNLDRKVHKNSAVYKELYQGAGEMAL